MARQKIIGWSTLLVLLLNSSLAVACGDRLLVLGPGATFGVPRAEFRGSVIMFMNPDDPGFASFKDTKLQQLMKQAGHLWAVATSWDDLAATLKLNKHDVVLCAYSDASKVEGLIETVSSQTVVLPWVYKAPGPDKAAIKRDRAAAKQQYKFIVDGPVQPNNLLSRVQSTIREKKNLLVRLHLGKATKPV